MGENKEQNDKESQFLDNVNKDNLEEAELEDVLESVPPEHRKVIERMIISSSIQMRSISSPETVVMKKLTPEHYIFNNDCGYGIFCYSYYFVKR